MPASYDFNQKQAGIHPMSPTDERVIELSRNKVLLLLLGSCIFVALGVWLFLMDAETIRREMPLRNPLLIHGVGVAGVVFFSLCAVMAARKMLDKKPGLVLNSSGIIDNSSGVSAGFIPWSEILGAQIFEVMGQRTLIILVKNPEAYVERGSKLKRVANRANYKMCGSPIAITSNTLKISFPELLSIFKQYQQKFGPALKASV
jgi:hypothetical protein